MKMCQMYNAALFVVLICYASDVQNKWQIRQPQIAITSLIIILEIFFKYNCTLHYILKGPV